MSPTTHRPSTLIGHDELDAALGASLRMAAHVASTLVMVGQRQFDRFCVAPSDADGAPRVVSLEQLTHDAIGARASWLFEPGSGQVRLLRTAANHAMPATRLPSQLGRQETMPLSDVLAAFAELAAPPDNQRVMLLIDASLLFEDAASPRAEDFQMLRALERHARNAARSHVLVLRVAQSAAVPPALLGNPKVRTVHLPAATREVRKAYAQLRCEALAGQCHSTADAVSRVVAGATEDWNLDQVDALIQSAQRNRVNSLVDIEELSRAIRVGTAKSPWVGQQIRDAVRQAPATLEARVKGQPAAIQAVVTSLKKACTGLVGGHEGRNTNLPRGVFVFSGPTGTGKTELAKALAQMVYGEEIITRLDCSELSAEHSVARLIGAPPGYVGYERGGELTEAVRAKPNSLILFDEIEKGHPRLMDIFLQILSDGRLTNGTGETADFSQSVIVFTSNLGMYQEQTDALGRIQRVARFGYDTPFETVQSEVREAVREEFVNKLGRPEILGRLGGHQNVIVFDFLRDLQSVAEKFIGNLTERCQRLHAMSLEVTPTLRSELVARVTAQPEALLLGGRGLATEMDRMLVDPLAAYLFDVLPAPARLTADWVNGQVQFIPGA